jgi:hypothetical protein
VTLERTRPESCLSDLVLDRLVAGELREEGELAAHLSSCAACRDRRDQLAAERTRFPDEVFVAGLAANAARTGRRWWAFGGSAAAVAVAGAAALLLTLRGPVEPGVRTKGTGLTLELIARRADGRIEALPATGGRASPGEALRFKIRSARAAHVAVVGLDAAGVATAYAPSSGAAPSVAAATDTLLDGSVVLDETLGPERVVAVACERALSVDELVAAGKRALATAGNAPARVTAVEIAGCAQTSVLYEKVSRK